MAINPLQLPRWADVPRVDFTPLGDIGQAIADRRQRERLQEAAAASTGPDGQIALGQFGARALAAGDVQAGLAAARIAEAQAEREATGARADRAAASLDAYRRQSLELQRQGLTRPTDEMREYEYARSQGFEGTLSDWIQRKRAGAGEYGLQPVWGRDEQGNPVMMQAGKSGAAIRTQLPPGVTLSGKEPIRMDAGTHFILMDPLTRQVIGQVPKNIEGKEAAEERGKAMGQAQAALPNTLAKAEQTVGLIDAMINHPGRETATGMSRWVDPRNYVPGTNATDFATRADQLQGRTFLEAYEAVKGAGAITEVEGTKAEQAIARLNRSQSDAEYVAALRELRGIISTGMERARARAGQSAGAPAMSPGATPSPAVATNPGRGAIQPVAPARAAPQVGAVQDGWRFMGGDPARPESWQRVR
ncbi:hypothetical protein [Rhodovulum sp. PH10]|uniref:hypothetical protein n=1 Tax=Rhodovulum sp. PH10 TaxID=1187851 RepID=UPI00058F1E75|nr:hypothetical protein [Rhodovulum sp. PH10]